jgi:hypothetical protein
VEPVFGVPFVVVEEARVLTAGALEEELIDGFDEGIEAGVDAVDKETDKGGAGRRDAHLFEELEAEEFGHHGAILREVVEDKRLETEECLAGDELIEIELEAGLGGDAAAVAAGADADPCYRIPLPGKRSLVVSVE